MSKYPLEHAKLGDLKCDHGDCRYKPIEGTKFCPRHGGNRALQIKKEQTLYNFRRTTLHQRIIQLAGDPKRHSLKEELGVVRLILEEYVNKCADFTMILRYTGQITGIVDKIRVLVADSLKLDAKLGDLLSKEEMLKIAQELLDAVVDIIDDTDKIEEIADKFNESLSKRNDLSGITS